MLRVLATVFGMMFAVQAHAQQVSSFRTGQPMDRVTPAMNLTWSIEEVTDGSVPEEIVPDNREMPSNGLPDGKIAVPEEPEEEGDIAKAWYSEPTTRYRHAVLGDEIEAGALKIETPRGKQFTYRPQRNEVFEDITPRLADLDDDGTTEVITILTSRLEGASVAVFGLVGDAFVKKAQTPFIGRSNRWLNIAAIGRFTGRRNMEIAIVERPHLAGLFKLYFFNAANPELRTPGQVGGFSNHEIGSAELRLSAAAFIDNDRLADIIVPSFDRRTLYALSLAGGNMKLLTRINLPAAVNRAILVEQENGATTITVGLDNDRIYRITSQ